MKYVLVFILGLHGLVHVMGFAKAFGYGNWPKLTKSIPKKTGAIWLLACLLFLLAGWGLFQQLEWWPVMALFAVAVSQVVILCSWSDAKFGTIANILVLAVAIPAWAHNSFRQAAAREARRMIEITPHKEKTIITQKMLNGLPPPVQKWLTISGCVGKEAIQTVRLKEKGEMRLKKGGKWMPFRANQYYTIDPPAFVWIATVEMMPWLQLAGMDKFENGEGEMVIKLLSLVNMVKEGHNANMNTATIVRYLGEMCWYPAAALSNYISWEAIDSTAAKATMNYKGQSVSGIFTFDENGDIASFEAERYYSNGAASGPESWVVRNQAFKNFEGYRVPSVSSVTWQLEEGDFTWLNMEITSLEFNKEDLYH